MRIPTEEDREGRNGTYGTTQDLTQDRDPKRNRNQRLQRHEKKETVFLRKTQRRPNEKEARNHQPKHRILRTPSETQTPTSDTRKKPNS
jgi:hypothetical protein